VGAEQRGNPFFVKGIEMKKDYVANRLEKFGGIAKIALDDEKIIGIFTISTINRRAANRDPVHQCTRKGVPTTRCRESFARVIH